MWDFPLFPDEASTVAPQVDALYFGLLLLAGFFIVLIGSFVVYFLIKYRAGSDADRSNPPENNWVIETTWIAIPTLLAVIFFFWGAKKYFEIEDMPPNAVQVFVVAKQWMWKFEHPQGQREINELHVPVNRPVRLKMTSPDVIHSFYVPDFRVKQDVVPGRYTNIWFQATKVGTFRLRCAEYCGTNHSKMTGKIIVMKQADYDAWLSARQTNDTLVAQGRKVFTRAGCSGCHAPDSPMRAPTLSGLYGSRVTLDGGGSVIANDKYIRDSIFLPRQQVVAGFAPIMPSFQGQLSESDVFNLIEYIKSLSAPETDDEDKQPLDYKPRNNEHITDHPN